MAGRIAGLVSEKGGHTYYVGGYVRDELLHIENKDIDIEVHGITVEELEAILDSVGVRTEMGASFGVYGLRGFGLDIAMPRKEEAIGRGHKDFKVDVDPFIGTYKAAIRRDFTINALMQDVLTGEIVDHFGGVKDLENGILRHVNSDTFVEDPLRVLRAAQFSARFAFRIAEETIELCRCMELDALAQERIMGELEKALLKAQKPSIFFEEMRTMQQLSFWFPEVEATIGVMQNPLHHPEGDVWTHTMLVLDRAAELRDRANDPLGFMLTALMHDLGKPAVTTVDEEGRICQFGHENRTDLVNIALSRITNAVKQIRYVLNMTKLHMRANLMAEERASQIVMNRIFDEALDPEDLALFVEADHMGRKDPPPYDAKKAFLQESLAVYKEMIARPCVMGKDLIEAGLKPGEEFSELLAFAHRLHLSGVPKEKALQQTLAEYGKFNKRDKA